jgi:hypothetical protein
MARDFLRRIDGYNRWFSSYSGVILGRDAILTNNAPVGPGRVEEVMLMANNVAVPGLMNDAMIVTIDGVVCLSSTMWTFFYSYDYSAAFGPITSRAHGSTFAVCQRIAKIDYETSFSLSAKNLYSPIGTEFYIILAGRVGR